MNSTAAKISEKNVAQALIKVRAMDDARKIQVASEIAEQQPILLSMVLAQTPVATSNSSTRGRVKLLHPWQRDGGTLFGRIALGNLNR